MGIVIGALTGLILIAAIVWLTILSVSAAADRRAARQAAAEAAETQRLMERDKRMREHKIKLHCMNCEQSFLGPLTDDGCPSCHTTSLVIPEQEYRETLKQSRG